MQRLTQNDFDALFSLMEKSFPADEHRGRTAQRALFADSDYAVYGIKDGADVKAFISTWRFDDFVYIEHFAVNPSCRNNGVGKKMLNDLIERLGKPVCLEVEPPVNGITRRRIGFYERNGFFLNTYPYEQPPMAAGKKALKMYVMTSGAAADEQRFQKIKSALYEKVHRVVKV